MQKNRLKIKINQYWDRRKTKESIDEELQELQYGYGDIEIVMKKKDILSKNYCIFWIQFP